MWIERGERIMNRKDKFESIIKCNKAAKIILLCLGTLVSCSGLIYFETINIYSIIIILVGVIMFIIGEKITNFITRIHINKLYDKE